MQNSRDQDKLRGKNFRLENACVTEAYANLWKSDNNELVMINNIIMKAMPKEAKDY